MRLDLDDLAVASRKALMVEWREVVGSPTPKHLSKLLMVQILSYTYQLDTVGGYTKCLDSRLKSTARCDCPASYKLGHKVGLSYGGSGSCVGLIMQPAFDVASGVVGSSVS